MSFLTGIEIRRLIAERQLVINASDPRYPFNPDEQVTEDAIDLRLSPLGLVYKKNITSVDYVNDDLENCFDMVVLPLEQGYVLEPGAILFTQTLEIIAFPNDLVGFVLTRSTFARMGLMINCVAPKFAVGIRWAFPLQLVNTAPVSLIIYPYTVVAQLMIATMQGASVAYSGRYQNTYQPVPPLVLAREKQFLRGLSAENSQRTTHILLAEIKAEQEKVRSELAATPVQTDAAEPVHRPGRATRLRQRRTVRTLVATLGALLIGVVGSLIASDDWNYWKGLALLFGAVLGLLLAIVPAYVASSDRHGAGR